MCLKSASFRPWTPAVLVLALRLVMVTLLVMMMVSPTWPLRFALDQMVRWKPRPSMKPELLTTLIWDFRGAWNEHCLQIYVCVCDFCVPIVFWCGSAAPLSVEHWGSDCPKPVLDAAAGKRHSNFGCKSLSHTLSEFHLGGWVWGILKFNHFVKF